jgi:predicted phosphodiesterase
VTRWGVLSDIHGNLPALERALAGLRARSVDRIAVLGDNLGRGDSAGCVRLIRDIADVSVVGNRDLDWQDRVDDETKAYVLGLPRLAQVDGVTFSHGDPRLTRDLSTAEITRGFRRAHTLLAVLEHRAWIFGHSHRARVWTLPALDQPPVLLFDAAVDTLPATIQLGERTDIDTARAINAGSVGLPFPGKGPASALVYDSGAGLVEIFPV